MWSVGVRTVARVGSERSGARFESWLEQLDEAVSAEVQDRWRHWQQVAVSNHRKVLRAFQKHRVTDFHLKGSTGYGYGDSGREVLDRVFADVFGAEAALVRPQIVSGTQAIAACLFGVLRPGDELLLVGPPYDTLEGVIGVNGSFAPGSLAEWGVSCRQLNLRADGRPDPDVIAGQLRRQTRMVLIQRSRGYSWRPSLPVAAVGELVRRVKETAPDVVCFVDNCYGEFVEPLEPTDVGADLIAGSLIKNPGGGLAPTGGYIAGKKELVDLAAGWLTAPGLAGEVGPTLDTSRLLFQGLFLAPLVVNQALQGAVYIARLFEKLGFVVDPGFDQPRTDIIQAIRLGSPGALVAFCQGIQEGSPVDSHIKPEPSGMPGYDDAVVMAAGTFIQGASIELSADGPMREPYAVYVQGGLSREYVRLAALTAVRKLAEEGLIKWEG